MTELTVANRGYFDATLDAIYYTGAWIVSKITRNNPLLSIDRRDTLKHEIIEAVMITFDRHDANNRNPPVNMISPSVLLKSEIDKLERENKDLKTKLDNHERKRKSQTDDSDHNDDGQVGPKRVQRNPNTK